MKLFQTEKGQAVFDELKAHAKTAKNERDILVGEQLPLAQSVVELLSNITQYFNDKSNAMLIAQETDRQERLFTVQCGLIAKDMQDDDREVH